MTRSPGSDATFRGVFDGHHDAVHRYCLRRLNVEDANEATAEVFLVAWRRIDSVPEEPGTLPWLYGVARNVVRNHRRTAHRSARLVARLGSVAEAPPDQTETQVVRHRQLEEVHDALSRLRSGDRELLRLKAWEELSNQEIGEILGLSGRAVEGRYGRLLTKLEKMLRSEGRRERPRLGARRQLEERGEL